MIDTHCHLTHARLRDEEQAVIDRARDAGLAACVSIGTGLDDARAVLELSRRHEVAASRLDVTPDSEQLGLLARMVDQKKLRPHVEKIFALGEARAAQRQLATGHVAGKLVLNL